MSRLDEALRRAHTAAAELPRFNVPSPRALESFALLEQVPVREPEKTIARPEPPATDTSVSHRPAATARDDERVPSALALNGPFAERLVVNGAVTQMAVEQYRRVAAALHHAQRDRGIRVVMVASALPGEGKTLTAANLALTISESFRQRVLVVDADLRHPMIHEMLGLENAQGLNDVLAATAETKLPIVALSANLAALPAGRPNPDPMSGLTSERMGRVIAEAAELYDWVILDTPPLALFPDANLLAAMVDAAVLVVAAGRTPARSVEQAADALGRDRIIGIVLNRADEADIPSEYRKDQYSQAAEETLSS